MENDFLKQATYIRYVAKLSKFVQISMLTSTEYRRIFENQKGLGTSFQATFLIDFFDKKIHFVILHKLAKFHYQIVFTSQVIKQYVFRVSWLGISWCHDVWIFRKLKFDYLKNEKSFRSAIKKSFSLVLQVVSFRHTKRTSKNLADTEISLYWFFSHKFLLILILCRFRF